MFTFLRKIRQRLVRENKVKNYLLYAIGEILLVVIGILIALQINNNNLQKTERLLELTYMQNFLEDLKQDTALYAEYARNNVKIYYAIDSLVNSLQKKNRKQFAHKSAYWARMVTAQWKQIKPVDQTYEQMKSSGLLRIINKRGVADGIAAYYNSIHLLDTYNDAGLIWAADYVTAMGKLFDAKISLTILKEKNIPSPNPDILLTEDPVIINELLNAGQYFYGALSLGETESAKKSIRAEELIRMIQSEYGLE
jgi:hypothetical protein